MNQHTTSLCAQVRPYAFEAPKSFAGPAGGNGVQYGILEYAGSIPKPHASGEAKFSVLKGVLTDNEAAQLLSMCSQTLSEEIGSGRARDLDSVDGRHRFAVDIAEFGVLSSKCAPDVRPLVETALLPLVRQKYDCPTASLSSAYFRRFVPEERRFVPPHYEHGSFAVLVIALQEPTSYTGGFFVQGSGKAFMDRRFIQLSRGDICLFQYDLCHGVDVQEGSQLELVLHFKDSPQAVADGTFPWYWRLDSTLMISFCRPIMSISHAPFVYIDILMLLTLLCFPTISTAWRKIYSSLKVEHLFVKSLRCCETTLAALIWLLKWTL